MKSSVPAVRSRSLNLSSVVGWYRDALTKMLIDPNVQPSFRQEVVAQLEAVDVFRRQLETFRSLIDISPTLELLRTRIPPTPPIDSRYDPDHAG